MKFNDLSWQQRRQLAYRLYSGLFNDVNLPYTVIENQTDEQLAEQVIDFFKHGSELVYPAKYIFCNIVYSYYLHKYFQCDFNAQLNDLYTLYDSPCPVLYNDRSNVYKRVLDAINPNIEVYQSTTKTRKYFKMEFLINDEDLSEVCPVSFFKKDC